MNLLKKLSRDEEGASLVEYTVLIGVITVVVIGLVVAVGAWVGDRWTTLCTTIADAGVGVIDCSAATGGTTGG